MREQEQRRLTIDLPEDSYLGLEHELEFHQELGSEGSEKTIQDLVVEAVNHYLDPTKDPELIESILKDGLVLARLVADVADHDDSHTDLPDLAGHARRLEAKIQYLEVEQIRLLEREEPGGRPRPKCATRDKRDIHVQR